MRISRRNITLLVLSFAMELRIISEMRDGRLIFVCIIVSVGKREEENQSLFLFVKKWSWVFWPMRHF